MKKIIYPIVVLTIFLQLSLVGNGQSNLAKYEVDSKETCETTHRFVELLAKESSDKNERIFVISKLSKKERYKLNKVRLSYAYTALQLKSVKPQQIIIATGQRTSEKDGKMEFYLGSQLFLVVWIESGKRGCLLCCDYQ